MEGVDLTVVEEALGAPLAPVARGRPKGAYAGGRHPIIGREAAAGGHTRQTMIRRGLSTGAWRDSGPLRQAHHDPRLMSWSAFSPCLLRFSAASIAKSTISDWLL
jgi:hypothetical protein